MHTKHRIISTRFLPLLAAGSLAWGACSSDGSTPSPTPDAGVDAGPPAPTYPGYRVQGRDLFDRCGEKVVLRGVNEMVVWSTNKDGSAIFPEIAKTGANSVRIVWTVKDGTPEGMDKAIGNAIANKLIPIIELHDATGKRELIASMVDYWVKPEVVAIVKKYEKDLIVNIANEAGDGSVALSVYTEDYSTAIQRMRAAGYQTPIMIDAPSYGQSINVMLGAAPDILAADPHHNVIFSVHMWWNDPEGALVKAAVTSIVTKNLPTVVGEFAHHAMYPSCTTSPFAYKILLEEAQKNGIGWLVWSWGTVKNNDCKDTDPFDMTTDGLFTGLTGYGLEVAVTDPNSIKNTSVIPKSILTGSCN